MSIQNLNNLAALIHRECDALLAQWRAQVRQLDSAKHLDTPTLNDHVPDLLEELSAAFRLVSDETIPEALLEGSRRPTVANGIKTASTSSKSSRNITFCGAASTISPNATASA